MEHLKENEAIVEVDEDGGWVDTHHNVDTIGTPASGEDENPSEIKVDEKVPV